MKYDYLPDSFIRGNRHAKDAWTREEVHKLFVGISRQVPLSKLTYQIRRSRPAIIGKLYRLREKYGDRIVEKFIHEARHTEDGSYFPDELPPVLDYLKKAKGITYKRPETHYMHYYEEFGITIAELKKSPPEPSYDSIQEAKSEDKDLRTCCLERGCRSPKQPGWFYCAEHLTEKYLEKKQVDATP